MKLIICRYTKKRGDEVIKKVKKVVGMTEMFYEVMKLGSWTVESGPSTMLV